jgi:hypothetical protein
MAVRLIVPYVTWEASFLITVSVRPAASWMAVGLCWQTWWRLRNNLSRLKSCSLPLASLIRQALSYCATSPVVKTAWQLRHSRRLQTWLFRFWGRELVTWVLDPQYMQTMSIYCHNAIKKSSGKPYGKAGKTPPGGLLRSPKPSLNRYQFNEGSGAYKNPQTDAWGSRIFLGCLLGRLRTCCAYASYAVVDWFRRD